MTSIVAEFTDKNTMGIPPSHRDELRKTGLPPNGWKIWIGPYEGKEGRRYHHTSAKVVSHLVLGIVPPEVTTQISTFAVGSLCIHTFSSITPPIADLVETIEAEVVKPLVRIWPNTHSDIDWPTTPLGDADVDRVSHWLMRIMAPQAGRGSS